MPVHILPSVALNGGFVSRISDVAPQIWTAITLMNRGSFALLAAGLLATAVAVHPRLELDDAKKQVWGLAGGAGLLAGAALIVATITWSTNQLAERDAWRAAHEQRREDPVVDLQAIRGTVDLEHGGRTTLDLEVQFLAGGGSAATFSLNPGLEVDGVRDASGAALPFSHDNGLLDIDLGSTPPSGQATGVRVRAHGRPDLRFAYLDSAVDFNTVEWQDAQIVILGNLNGFVERNYVALPSSIAWLPRPGASVGAEDPRQRPRDFFELDLNVRTPSGWTVAGPGKAEPTGDGQRFAPSGPVPEVVLVAGRFDRRTTEVEGIEVEVLFHPDHLRNLDFFADAREEIETVAAERFTTARELGMPYPYRQLTLVEVPWTLRAYGGGWRMDTERAPPGMLLVRDVVEDPKRAVNALYLKTSALATAILDGAGRERAAAMIANLLRDHRGATFTAADLDRAAQDAGVDLAGLVGDFLHQTDLPGFIVSPAELERLPDDDQGTPQYQTRLFVRNGEAAPGLFRLRYAVRGPGGARWDSSEPVLISGNTIVGWKWR